MREEARSLTFNQDTKAAVLSAKNDKRCCKKAYLLGLLLFGQSFDKNEIRFASETVGIVDRAEHLLSYFFKDTVPFVRETVANQHRLKIGDRTACETVLSFFGLSDLPSAHTIPRDIFVCDDCRIAFLKGAFLACGTVSSPEKRYHLEMTTAYFNLSRELLYVLRQIGMDGKYTKRLSHYVIYYKDSEKIADFLGLIGATQENFRYYNTLIEKELRNNLNRLNNCETANMQKQIETSCKQVAAITHLTETGELDDLSHDLRETASLRLENPDASLSALAELHDPPITKSCVNRRLKKLVELAGLAE